MLRILSSSYNYSMYQNLYTLHKLKANLTVAMILIDLK